MQKESGQTSGSEELVERRHQSRWTSMGTRSRFSPIHGQIPVLIFCFVMVQSFSIASSCGLGNCWWEYNDAKNKLGEEVPGVPRQDEIQCKTLRTYSHCVNNLSGCKGNIRFHTVKRMLSQKMESGNCDINGPIYVPSESNSNRGHEQAVCAYQDEDTVFQHCGLFGDPHLRTFGGEFQTCKVEGAWPLIDNDYITVQVTNDAVKADANATATSKLTVMIKANDCADAENFVTYQAETDQLPPFFDDGRDEFGPEGSVSIREIRAGTHVEIYARYIDTTILVRQVGRYLTFSVRMPEKIVKNSRSNSEDISLQLCVEGCPVRERIDYKYYLASQNPKFMRPEEKKAGKQTMTREEAVERCISANVMDFYFDSCVFDLLTTGDTNFTLAANVAMQDVRSLHGDSGEPRKNRTDLNVYDKKYSKVFERPKSGAPPRTLHWWCVFSALILCLMMSFINDVTLLT